MASICIKKVFWIFFVQCICVFHFSWEYAAPVDGYIPLENVVCPGNDFIGGYRTGYVSRCKKICDENFLCVAFQFSAPGRGGGMDCWPKALCDVFEQQYGRWLVYRKVPGHGGCTFDAFPGYALYGHNDIVLSYLTINGCKNKCLRDDRCLSFDYNNDTGVCFISYDSKETSQFFGQHDGLTYYQKRCGPGVEFVSQEVLHSSQGSVISLTGGHCIRTFGPYGGTTGSDFTYEKYALLNITSIQVSFGTYISGIGLQYGSQPLVKYGSRYARTIAIEYLSDDEYIVSVEGRYGTLLDQLTFVTNKRTLGPYGSGGGRSFTADGHGQPLLYISGKSSGQIVSIAVHFPCLGVL